jgi:hypothetical protein
MELNMMVIGKMDRLMVSESLLILILMFIMASFTKIGPTDMEFIYIRTVKSMKAIGKMMYRKDRGEKFLKMDPFMKVFSKMGRNGATELINGQTILGIKETG